jgi:succinyl-diaminopimelate desuccinylase
MGDFMYKDMNEYLKINKMKILSDMTNFLSIPSISDSKKDILAALDFIINLGKEYGLNSNSLLDNRVGLIEIGEGEEIIGVLAHLDVVPVGDLSAWSFDPFNSFYDNEFIYGRGSIDDKCSIISIIHIMKYLQEKNIVFNKKIQLIIGTQEEVSWTEINEYVKKYPLPDYGFTPDGSFPVLNREKGYLDIELAFNEINSDIAVVGGSNINSVPDHCLLKFKTKIDIDKVYLNKYNATILNDYEIKFSGVSAHSSIPDDGVNSIINASLFCNELGLKHPILDYVHKYFTNGNYGQGLGFYEEDDYLNGEFVHKTSCIPSKVEKNTLFMNLRLRIGHDKDMILEKFRKTLDQKIILSVLEYLPPLYLSKDLPFVLEMSKAYEEIIGERGEYDIAYGTSYAKSMPNIVCWGPLFENDLDLCHKPDERISITTFEKSTLIYANYLEKMAISTDSFKV